MYATYRRHSRVRKSFRLFVGWRAMDGRTLR